MYEAIKNVILNGKYELKDYLKRINLMFVELEITEEQKNELDNLARENANPENSYATLQEQINSTFTEIADLKSRVEKLEKAREEEGGTGGTGEEPTEPVEEDEYPEFVQPTGAHNCYNKGMGVTFMGEKYISLIDGCVWDPLTYPQGWKKVTEDDTTEEATDTAESEDNINE